MSAPEQKHCCCRAEGAKTCFELRYYGHSPTDRNQFGEECECPCHDEIRRRREDDGEEDGR